MKRKVISLILCFVMFTSYLSFDASAQSINSKVVADLTNINIINKTGMPVSTEVSKTGAYTMKWGNSDIYRDVSVPISTNDLSGDGYLEMWVYSTYPSSSQVTIALISENASTRCMDYYYSPIKLTWEGWKLISLKTGDDGDFEKMNAPVGFNKIDEIKLWSSFGGNTPVYGTTLYFDKIVYNAEQSTGINDEAVQAEKQFVIADFSKPANVAASGFPSSKDITLSGSCTLKWAAPNLHSAPKISVPITDWTNYGYMAIDIYSEKATDSTLHAIIFSENTDTAGKDDYYRASINVNWTGWKRLTFGFGTYDGGFSKGGTPVGWDHITGFTWWNNFGNVDVDPSTVVYIDKIWLGGTPSTLEYNPEKNFILDSKTEVGFEKVVDAVKAMHPNGGHPRLLLSESDFTRLKEQKETDPFLKKTYANILSTVDDALAAGDSEYKDVGSHLPRTEAYMLPSLALVYNLTDDETLKIQIKERMLRAMNVVGAWKSWSSYSFLDVGDFNTGFSLAYDWMYDEWSEDEKRMMRNAMVKNSFAPAMTHLRGASHFAGETNNWNQVVTSGLGMAALAMCDEPGYEDLCNEVLNRTFEVLPKALNTFAPDGVSLEGPNYWSYANQRFFKYVYCLMTAAGTDYGLSGYPGLSNTGYYITAMNGTVAAFNYGDGDTKPVSDSCMHLIARIYNQPEISAYRVQRLPNGGDWKDFVMYHPDYVSDDYRSMLKLDNYMKGDVNIASSRSTWYGDSANYIAYKGGYNQASHGDLDMGTFVFDSMGIRWITDLGSEEYTSSGYWDFLPGEGRWDYYRKRAEGHNTLVINPDDGDDQDPMARGEIYKFEKSDNANYGLINLTDAYDDDVQEVIRGIAFVNNKSQVIVQDEIKNADDAEIYSFFHTTADIELRNSTTAIFSLSGKKMRADLVSDAGQFKVMPASPLPSSPPAPEGANANKSFKKLAVHLTNAKNPTISVVLTPLAGDDETVNLPEYLPFNEWDKYLEGGVGISSLAIDGIPLDGFSPNNINYNISTGEVGEITATAEDGIELVITQAENNAENATVLATNSETGNSVTYTVSFDEKVVGVSAENILQHEIVGVEASAVPQPENPPKSTFDGSLDTRWSSEGEQWIEWDLGGVKKLDKIMLAFMSGNIRSQFMKIEVSKDGTSYTTVFDGQSSGATLELETFSFEAVDGRFIKFTGNGTTAGTWNSITEIVVPHASKEFSDIEDHWAREYITYLEGLGLVNGVTDSLYAPDQTLTIAEFVTMMLRISGIDEIPYITSLTDVNPDDWFSGYIQAALDSDIIPDAMLKGNSIRPNEAITREEMCAIAVKIYETVTNLTPKTYGLSKFVDVDEINKDYVSYVDKGITLRLVKGTDETHISPKATATRAEASVIMKRLFIMLAV